MPVLNSGNGNIVDDLRLVEDELVEMAGPIGVKHLNAGVITPVTAISSQRSHVIITLRNLERRVFGLAGTRYSEVLDKYNALVNALVPSTSTEMLRRSVEDAMVSRPISTNEIIPFGLDMISTTWAVRQMIADTSTSVDSLIAQVAPGMTLELTGHGDPTQYDNGQEFLAKRFTIYVEWKRNSGRSHPTSVTLDSKGAYCVQDLLQYVVRYSTAPPLMENDKCKVCQSPLYVTYTRGIGTVNTENILAVILAREFRTCAKCAMTYMKSTEQTEQYEQGGAVPNF